MVEENWQNLVSMFFDQAQRLGNAPFLWKKEGGKYEPISWAETAEKVSALARGLAGLGIDAGDRVALISGNRPEWMIAELAIQARRAIAVPAFTTNTVDDHLHIFSNSGAKAAILSSRKLSARVMEAAHRAGTVEKIIAMEELELSQAGAIETLHWDKVLEAGRQSPDDVAKEAGEIGSGDTAIIIYTSGTGGAPKGVMLHHGAIMHNCRGAAHALAELGLGSEVFLSFLPLSHSYEHMAGHFFPVFIGAQIYYSQGIEHLSANMAEAHPTLMTAVPRLYELMHGRIVKDMKDASPFKKKLFWRAVELGRRKIEGPELATFGEKLSNKLLDILVRSKVKKRFGGHLKALISGGAPLNYDIGLFFSALGLRLLQGYGQTESAPLISVNLPTKIKLRTVG
ncbi:MAG: AMP-binding protein, partial [Rhodospirillales bacterium]|nr:AMP-binding protein [Rhodospirillales bacterium]